LSRRVDLSLEEVGLTERARERVETYSGGMKRRVNIAVALLHSPEVLVMDEPTVGIDPQSRNHILETVKRLNASGLTVLYTSHYMGEVEYLCTRIGIMDHGSLVAEGSLAELRCIVGEQTLITVRLAPSGAGLDVPRVLEVLLAIPGVCQATPADDGFCVSTLDPSSVLPAITTRADSLGRVQSLSVREPDLEAVFLHLTGHALRD
jgi:ABC-2 type transport system ATP-binding protein